MRPRLYARFVSGPREMMDSKFDPASIERRIAALWEETGAFRADRPERRDAEAYSIVIPPPNVTGTLHMGHALNVTLQDILCRFERMRGKNVLWQPGTDHAGIATQMVVERQLMERKEPGRVELGRERFLERVWAWKAESGGAILRQLKRLGASCDWSRERFTMDEGLSRAVVKVFVRLHREGLIYRDKRLVNWDPTLQTAISDLEVQQVEVKGSLWVFRYPVEGRIYDPADASTYVAIATTRPETMLGDAAVAIHPGNERLKNFIGQKLRLPLVGRSIPVVGDEYADPEKGTGAVKITPAHDFNDFDVGRRHNLPLISVIDAQGRMALEDNDAFYDGVPGSAELAAAVVALHGLDRFAARRTVVELMSGAGLLERVEPYTHMVPHGDRSGTVVEPFLTDQWYVDAAALAGPALEAVRDGRTRFTPQSWEKTYFDWLENIRPWCISRQLWWGHRIPAWFSPWGQIFVAESEEEAFAAALADGLERGVLAQEEADALVRDPDRLRDMIRRDEDVLDTWFSSALWPFSTLGWPDQTADLKRFYPTSVLVTGFDIIFFWVARMMMMGLHLLEEPPFRDVYIHALVRDEKGAKMSKSKGNVIDPLRLVDAYGADALRFTLAAMAAQGRDIKLSESRVEGYRNFATKIWNAARFAQMNGCALPAGFNPKGVRETLNRWILAECARTAQAVETALVAYRFNEAAGDLYRFVWNVVCDWHLELSKPALQGEDGPIKDEARATIGFVLEQTTRMLHPFMPFLTEALWSDALRRDGALALQSWPQFAGLEDPEAENEIGWIVDLVSQLRSLRSEMKIPDGVRTPLVLVGADAASRRRLNEAEARIGRLVRIGDIAFQEEPPPNCAQILVRGASVYVPLAGVIDLAAERKRLEKERDRLNSEIAKVEARLANPKFLAGAKEEAIEENRARLEEARPQLIKIEAALERLR